MKLLQPKHNQAKKFDEMKYAVVIKPGYDFAIIEDVDFETESSFGVHGITIQHIRTQGSTGSRIKKSDVSYRMFDTLEEARMFQAQTKEFTSKIKLLREEIKEQMHKMKQFVGEKTN